MSRLLITADVHGSYATWMTLKSLLEPEDILVVAGDLFDTRYGRWGSPDFQPNHIRENLEEMKNQVYYIYGNCDEPSFYPGQSHGLEFQFMGLNIFLHHGHTHLNGIFPRLNLIIQGHTHLASLEKRHHTFFLNPGSLTCPRNGLYTYGIVKNNKIQIMNIKTKTELISLSYADLCDYE
jgi:putative phosphoesterase